MLRANTYSGFHFRATWGGRASLARRTGSKLAAAHRRIEVQTTKKPYSRSILKSAIDNFMIIDQTALAEIHRLWHGVEQLRGRIHGTRLTNFAFGSPIAVLQPTEDVAYNLPFLHACAVLNDTLSQLADEGHFRCKSWMLGSLLNAAKSSLSWVDFDKIKKIVEIRNQVAHEGILCPRQDCIDYIETIHQQLRSWGVL